MNALAFSNRLLRDLKQNSLAELAADERQEIQDAINGGIQQLDSVAPVHTKKTTGAIYIEPSVTIQLGVMNGSQVVTGGEFVIEQYGRTVRLEGDSIDNKVFGGSELLFPYGGPTGTVTATILSDAVPIPVRYTEFIGDMTILETGCKVAPNRHVCDHLHRRREMGTPRFFWAEPTAMNQNPPAPMVLRFHPIPDRAYRLSFEVMLAPARIEFSDLLSATTEIPLRPEHVEQYLLPIARGLMTTSSQWADPSTISAIRQSAQAAEARYATMISTTLATPRNRAGTKRGF